jgi:hypothetical protein
MAIKWRDLRDVVLSTAHEYEITEIQSTMGEHKKTVNLNAVADYNINKTGVDKSHQNAGVLFVPQKFRKMVGKRYYFIFLTWLL